VSRQASALARGNPERTTGARDGEYATFISLIHSVFMLDLKR
jgi:hypothetical protein